MLKWFEGGCGRIIMWYLNVKIWLCLTFMLLCCCWSIYCGKLIEEENIQSVEIVDRESVIAPNKKVMTNMYLFKTIDVQNNGKDKRTRGGHHIESYLNYKDTYGIRYIPKKETSLNNLIENNDSHNVDEPSAVVFNDIHLDEVISANEENNDDSNIEETNEQYTVEHIESENEKPFNDTAINHDLPLVLVSKEPIVEMLPNLVTSNNSLQNVEEMEKDETRNHIMKPSNKFANALNFLAARLKKLLYYSTDKNRIESKISPQLSSLGRFLNLFTIIKFDNVPCTTARKPLRQLSGTCYHEIECLQLGGIAVDRCAKGFGVCCVC